MMWPKMRFTYAQIHAVLALCVSLLLSIACGSSTNKADFQLTAAPSVTANQGAHILVKVTLTRDAGFTEPVTVSLANPAAGLAGIDVNDVVIAGEMTTGWLKISVAPTVAGGGAAMKLTLTGTSGKMTATKAMSLSVIAADVSAQEKIQAALAAGTLDAGTALLYRAYALFGDPNLPMEYAGSGSLEEDNLLLPDIRAAFSALTPDLQTRLTPFTVRPSDPGSWLSGADARFLAEQADPLLQAPLPPESCAALTAPGFQWVSKRSGSYPVRVWVSCEGDPAYAGYDNQSMQMLTETLAILNKVWQPMGELMGDGAGNPILDIDGGDDAIDIYLDRGTGVFRQEEVKRTSGLGQTFQDLPNVGKTYSGYVIIPETTYGRAEFHVTVIHELFHVFQLAHNGDLQAGGKLHWFTEASAAWAGGHYDRRAAFNPRGGYADPYGRFKKVFQKSVSGLNGYTERGHDYAAFIWAYFLEQDTGGPEIVGQVWDGLRNASGFAGADDAMNSTYSFVDNFRKFALRNINTELVPGDPLPLAKRYITQDREFRDDKVEPPYGGMDIAAQIDIQAFPFKAEPLAAKYFKFPVTNNQVKQVVFDFSNLNAWPGLDVDALVKIDGKWEAVPRDLNGKKELKFCRDSPGEKLDEIRFILSNHQRNPVDVVNSALIMTASISACQRTWKGFASRETSGPTVMKSSADVTWVFDEILSSPFAEVYRAKGTVTYSFTDPGCASVTYSPSTSAIGPDDGLMRIEPDPTGGFVVTGTALTAWLATAIFDCPPDPAVPVQALAGIAWFGTDPPIKLTADGKTISGSGLVAGSAATGVPIIENFSFTLQ